MGTLLIPPGFRTIWEDPTLAEEVLMPRTARACSGGYTYHVLNRGNARATVFHKPDD
jgi:hypothetical protein